MTPTPTPTPAPAPASVSRNSWAAFHAAQPALADTVRTRFGQYRHHVLATLRADGSPRVTGLEVDFRFGEMWLGMMPYSRKAQDLHRDPRFAVQANPGPDAEMRDGDVRVSGRAVEVTDPDTLARFVEEVKPPEPFHLFRAEPAEVVLTTLDGEDLVVRVWRPGGPVRTIRRGPDNIARSEP
ncbi:pyridoxamine 5'-phosphate oxidase family protein [Streptomyces sp. NPDC014734]|uniref:pyridoxamine 5'-phosphate oxidase family protein n=1 Tax=Streptomyces sp. NPDC014734 TaxID=3364886 RepID=UPI0036FB544B